MVKWAATEFQLRMGLTREEECLYIHFEHRYKCLEILLR
jgi:hypothetical protein